MDGAWPLLEIKDLHHVYQREGFEPVIALRGMDLSLNEGEWVAIVGANGSGKTTLARHLNGLLIPTQGAVWVGGRDTRDRSSLHEIRSQVGMVFQRPEDQIVSATVEDDVAFGPKNLGLPSGEIGERVRWALDSVGMWNLRKRSPHFLSVGQQQRVAIAGALAMRPRCLVLDEATTSLDPSSRRGILDLLRQLNAEGMALVQITHSMDLASQADRVVALNKGGLAFDGQPGSLFTDGDTLRACMLEPPPLASLAAGLARELPGFPVGLLKMEPLVEALIHWLDRGTNRTESRGVPDCYKKAPPGDTGRGGETKEKQSNVDTPLIVARDLRHTYLENTPFAARSLEGVSVSVYPGEVVALLGRTGLGKSTLLQLLAGLLKPDGGKITPGQKLKSANENGRFPIAMLFQRPEDQLFETFVGDDVAYGPRQQGLDGLSLRRRVRWAMDTAGLPFEQYKDRFTQGLSGGEQRKAALAGVFALRPHLLLLDEPTSGLDPRSQRELLDSLRRLNQDEGVAMMVATHRLQDVADLADRALVLDERRIAHQAAPRELFRDPELLPAFGLEPPAHVSLVHRLRSAGVEVSGIPLTVDEAIDSLINSLVRVKS